MTTPDTTPTDYRSVTRELLGLVIPLALSSGSVTLMYVVDRIFLTWYSQDALAAVLPASMWNFTLMSLFIGIASYGSTFVSQYEGAKRRDRVAATVWQGSYLAILCGAVLTFGGGWTAIAFAQAGHPEEVRILEEQYFNIALWGCIPVLWACVLSGFFSARHQAWVPMVVNFLGALINISFDYVLIFGWGEIPSYGIVGAAWATIAAEVVMLIAYLIFLWVLPAMKQYPFRQQWRFDRDLCRRWLWFGFPAGIHFLVDIFGFAIFMLMIGKLGKEITAATNLAFNLNSLAFMPVLGMGTAVSIVVGNRVGEGRPRQAIASTWIGFAMAASYTLFFAILYCTIPGLMLTPYLIKENAAEMAAMQPLVAQMLRFVAIYSVFDAMAIVFGGALRGAGDTLFAMLFSFATGWLVMVFPTAFGIHYLGWSYNAAWLACTAFILVLGVGFMLRFQKGYWLSMRVIEVPPPETLALEPAGAVA